jgi:hypothetical protein
MVVETHRYRSSVVSVKVSGIVLPTKLRIYPRNADNTAASEPLIVAVDLSKYAFE